jgi:glutamyl-tRNA reductase
MALKDGDRLHLIDLAVPRDIDPGAADLPGVRLNNLDDIQTAVASYIRQRRQTQPKVEAIVAEQQGQFGRWLRQRAVASTIQGLRARSEEVRLAEMRRALPKLPGLSERERAVVDQMTTRLVNKLLHPPTANLQAAAGDGRGAEYGEIAADLFDLNGAFPPAGRKAPTRQPTEEA